MPAARVADLTMTPRPLSRRSIFLGKMRALYGPGQDPEAGATGKYAPPRDWTPAGRLARPPQVVFLSAVFPLMSVDRRLVFDALQADPLIYSPGFDIVTGTNEFGYAIRLAVSLHSYMSGRVIFRVFRYSFDGSLHQYTIEDSTTDTPGRPLFQYAATFENPFPEEYLRVMGAYREAARMIEAARPGRTFVTLTAPWQGFRNLPKRYFTHLVAPDEPGGYYGTDFLHIHAGMPWIAPTTTYNLNLVDASGGHTVALQAFDDNRDAAFDASIARVLATRGRMPRYGLRLYGLRDTSALGVPPVTATYSEAVADPPDFGAFLELYTESISGGEYPYPLPADPPPTPNSYLGIPGRGGYFNGVVRAVDTINARISRLSADCEAILQDTADALGGSGIDVSLMGQTADITGESIAKEVAAYYGFDL